MFSLKWNLLTFFLFISSLDEEKDDLDDKDVEQVIATGSQLIQNVVPPELKLPDGEAPAIDENIEVDYHPPPPQNKNEVVKDRSIFLQVTEFLLERHALQVSVGITDTMLLEPGGCNTSLTLQPLRAFMFPTRNSVIPSLRQNYSPIIMLLLTNCEVHTAKYRTAVLTYGTIEMTSVQKN